MRISSSSMYRVPIESITRQQTEIERTQLEISSGIKQSELSKDPSAARQVADLERQLADGEQFASNTDTVTSRLGTVESTLDSAVDLMQRVRELAVMSLNGSFAANQRGAVATEVRALNDQLLALANRRDASGEYIFAGSVTNAAPLRRTGTGGAVEYHGDSVERTIRVDGNTTVKDGFTGQRTFMQVPKGNGYFSTAAATANTGTAVADAGIVTDVSTWNTNSGNYKIVFTVSGGSTNYEVRTGAGAALVPAVTGTYQTGQVISFLGAQMTIQGTPANGDEFTISPSTGTDQYQSIFATLDRQLTILETPVANSAKGAQQSTDLGNIIQQLDQALSNLGTLRSESGARLRVVEQSSQFRDDDKLDIQQSLSDLRDIDMAEALGRLNAQMTALQVAQQAYARIASRSLFDYL